MEGHGAGFDASEIQYIVNQAEQMLAIGQNVAREIQLLGRESARLCRRPAAPRSQ